MKKALIFYAAVFAVSIILPVIICFAVSKENSGSELVGIFTQCISLFEYYR